MFELLLSSWLGVGVVHLLALALEATWQWCDTDADAIHLSGKGRKDSQIFS